MTMTRTMHKLEPKCDQSCMQGTVQQTTATLNTNNIHYKTSSGHSRVFSCCSGGCSHASGLRTHVSCCCDCPLCIRVITPLVVNVPTYSLFNLYVNSLQIFVDSHIAKTGLLRCCLYMIFFNMFRSTRNTLCPRTGHTRACWVLPRDQTRYLSRSPWWTPRTC